MAFADELAIWINRNGPRFLRRIYIVQAFAGILLMLVGYHIGKVHFHLITEGIRTQGTIVGSEYVHFGRDDTAFMPVVEFQIGNRAVRFQDWKGSHSGGGINDSVPVIYDAVDPSIAMIDRPIWNWFPWAPLFVVGLFLVLVGVKGGLKCRRETDNNRKECFTPERR